MCGIASHSHLKYRMSRQRALERPVEVLLIEDAFKPKTHLNSHRVARAIVCEHIVFKRNHGVRSIVRIGLVRSGWGRFWCHIVHLIVLIRATVEAHSNGHLLNCPESIRISIVGEGHDLGTVVASDGIGMILLG